MSGESSKETPKIPWATAVHTPTASSLAPGYPSANFSSSSGAKKREKPPRKLAARLGKDNSTSHDSGEKLLLSGVTENADLNSITEAAKSGSMDSWDPMSFDYNSPSFNSYNSGPGLLMKGDKQEKKNICLFVDRIPTAITKEGLRNLFSKCGVVKRANIVQPKHGWTDTYGFIEYATIREAETAMQQLHNFDLGGHKLVVKVSESEKLRKQRMEKKQDDEAFFKTLNCVKNPKDDDSDHEEQADHEEYELSKEEAEKNEQNPLIPRYISPRQSSPEKPTKPANGSQSPSKVDLSSPTFAASLRAPSSFIIPETNNENSSSIAKPRSTSISSGSARSGTVKERPCHVCQQPTSVKCSRCKTPYCSELCQKQDWPHHKTRCSRSGRQGYTSSNNGSDDQSVTPKNDGSDVPGELKIAEDLEDEGFHISSTYDDEQIQSLQTFLSEVRRGRDPKDIIVQNTSYSSATPVSKEASLKTPVASPGNVASALNQSAVTGESEAVSERSPSLPSHVLPPKWVSSVNEPISQFETEIIVPLSEVLSLLSLCSSSNSLFSLPLSSQLPHKYTAIITSVRSCTRFCAIAASVEVKEALERLQEYGSNCTSVFYKASELTVGLICGYKSNSEEFFRVLVERVNPNNSVRVMRHDFGGHWELPSSGLFHLPEDILSVPCLRQRLSLYKLHSEDTFASSKYLLEVTKGEPVVIKTYNVVKAKNNPSITFMLCDLESSDGSVSYSGLICKSEFTSPMRSPDKGSKGRTLLNTNPSTSTSYKLLHLSSKVPHHQPPSGLFEIKPTLVVSPSVIWAHVMHPNIRNLKLMYNDLNAKYKNTRDSSYTPTQGEMCVAKYSQDQCYYRVEVLCVNNNATVDVHYVDYGNRDTVTTGQLRHIDPVFLTLPKQALQFSMAGIVPANGCMNWSDNARAFIKHKIMNRNVVVNIVGEIPKALQIELYDPDSSKQLLNNVMVSLGHAQVTYNYSGSRASTPSTPTGNLIGVSIRTKSAGESAGLRGDYNKSITSPIPQLTTSDSPIAPPLLDVPQTPSGSCSDSSNGVESGNNRKLNDVRSSPVKSPWSSLSTTTTTEQQDRPSQLSLSYLGRSGSNSVAVSPMQQLLQNLKTASQNVKSPQQEQLQSPTPSPSIYMVPWKSPEKRGSSGVSCVDTSFGSTSKQSGLSPHRPQLHPRKEGRGGSYSSKWSIDSVKLEVEGPPVQAFVSYVEHPLHFWIQVANPTAMEEYEKMFEKMNKIPLVPISSPTAGELCLCPHSEDGTINRARVLEIHNQKATIEFIDYGNKEKVSVEAISEVDAEMLKLPAQAVVCTLKNLLNPGGKKSPWKKEAIDFFKSRVCNGTVKVTCSNRVGVLNIVDVTVEGGKDLLKLMVENGLANTINSNKQGKNFKHRQSNDSPMERSSLDKGLSSRETSPRKDTRMKSPPYTTKLPHGGSEMPKLKDMAKDVPLSPRAPTQQYPKVSELTTVVVAGVGESFQVAVSEACSPDSLFIQVATQKLVYELDELFTGLNTHFQTNPPSPVLQLPSKGSLLCAKFSEDNCFYRVEVLDSSEGVCKVRFIDYGNIESVELSSMSPCPSQFINVPIMAIECALNGVSPPDGGSSWTNECISTLKSTTNGKLLQAKVVGNCNGKLLIELANDDVNIATELINKGYAAHKSKSNEKKLSSDAFSNQVMQPMIQVSDMKVVDVLEGSQEFNLLVSEACSPDSLFIQVATQKLVHELDELITGLNTHFQTNPPSPVLQLPSKGSLLCAKFSEDNCFYRVEVLDSSEGVCKVRFIDYGNIESVELSSMSPCPSQFINVPIMAIECALNGVSPSGGVSSWSSDCITMLKCITNGNLLQAKVVGNHNGKLLIELANNDVDIATELINKGYATHKSCVSKMSSDVVSPVSQYPQISNLKVVDIPTDTQNFNVLVSEVCRPDSLYIQIGIESLVHELDELFTGLNTHFQSNPPSPVLQLPSKGSLLCAKFSEDNCFYRVEVLNSSEGGCKVRFIDYGNIESVELSSMSPCPSQFINVPVMAIECALNGVSPSSGGSSWTNECITMLKYTTANCILQAKVINVHDDKVLIELTKDGVDVATELVNKGYATLKSNEKPISPEKQYPPISNLKVVDIPTGSQKFDVLVSEACQPDSIFIQIMTESSMHALGELFAGLKTHFQNNPPFPVLQLPSKGSLLCAKFSQDQLWYRVEVLDSSEGGCKVRFIDYGNIESVELSSMSPCPSQFINVPVMAVECALNRVSPSGGGSSWTNECITMLKHITSNCILRAKVVGNHNGKPLVELANDSIDIATELINKGCATPKSKEKKMSSDVYTMSSVTQYPQVCELRHSRIPTDTQFQVLVSEVCRPHSLYIQIGIESLAHELDELFTGLETHFQTNPPSPVLQLPSKGSLLCAKFSEDNCFYRVEVLDSSEGGCKVRFIDYGNVESVELSSMSPCPSQFINVPIMAIECALNGITPLGGKSQWPDNSESTTELKKLCADRLLVAKVVSTLNEHYYMIDLVDKSNNLHIASELIRRGYANPPPLTQKLSPRPPPVAVPSLSLPAVDTPFKVVVNHCASLSSIWMTLYDREGGLSVHSMLTELQGVYADPSKYSSFVPEVGAFCCSKHTSDDRWYRSKVVKVDGQKITVVYIDFGNFETLTRNRVCRLDLKFSKMPCQAFECCLNGVKPVSQTGLTGKAVESLKALIHSRMNVITAKIVSPTSNENDKPAIELFLDDECTESVANILIQSGYATQLNTSLVQDPTSIPAPPTPTPSAVDATADIPPIPLPYVTLPAANKFPVLLCHIESLTEFYVQVGDHDVAKTQLEMMEYLNTYTPGCGGVSKVIVGGLYIAQYSDGNWFRAQVIEAFESGNVEVFFFDFGNKELVSIQQLKPIDKKLLSWPIQAVRCGLYGIPIKEALSPVTSLEFFKTLMSTVSMSLCMVISRDPLLVDFEGSEGLSVCDQLTQKELFPQVSDLGMTSISSASLPKEGTSVVLVTEVSDPSDFWVQVVDVDTMKEFDKFTGQVQGYCGRSPGLRVPPVLGQLCCAKFSQDGQWYRARITKIINETTFDVLFLDYGNTEKATASSIRPFDRMFLQFPCQAVHCCLVDHTAPQDKVVRKKFRSLVEDRKLIAVNRGRCGVGKTVVELVDTSTDDDVYIHQQVSE